LLDSASSGRPPQRRRCSCRHPFCDSAVPERSGELRLRWRRPKPRAVCNARVEMARLLFLRDRRVDVAGACSYECARWIVPECCSGTKRFVASSDSASWRGVLTQLRRCGAHAREDRHGCTGEGGGRAARGEVQSRVGRAEQDEVDAWKLRTPRP
jgi:hypothetical protein